MFDYFWRSGAGRRHCGIKAIGEIGFSRTSCENATTMWKRIVWSRGSLQLSTPTTMVKPGERKVVVELTVVDHPIVSALPSVIRLEAGQSKAIARLIYVFLVGDTNLPW